MVHKDTAKGMAKETHGKVKKHVGRAAGDVDMEADGMAREGEGKVQKTFGKAKESVRDMLKH